MFCTIDATPESDEVKTWRSPSSAYTVHGVPTTFFPSALPCHDTPQTTARDPRPESTTALWGRLTEH